MTCINVACNNDTEKMTTGLLIIIFSNDYHIIIVEAMIMTLHLIMRQLFKSCFSVQGKFYDVIVNADLAPSMRFSVVGAGSGNVIIPRML
jgi:hypothetical protein